MEQGINNDYVFINCPFDDAYTPLLRAIVFCIYRCGFIPVTALNEDNGLDNRLHKIEECIEKCRYGIHDISRTELNENNLPRFNMPFELGIFFGAKRFGNKQQKTKSALIFDTKRYRYQEFISDLNGVDIKAHENNPRQAIRRVRDWLALSSRRTTIRGHLIIQGQFDAFTEGLPIVVANLGFEIESIPFNDFCLIVEESIKEMDEAPHH
jgi:hypothetical protein